MAPSDLRTPAVGSLVVGWGAPVRGDCLRTPPATGKVPWEIGRVPLQHEPTTLLFLCSEALRGPDLFWGPFFDRPPSPTSTACSVLCTTREFVHKTPTKPAGDLLTIPQVFFQCLSRMFVLDHDGDSRGRANMLLDKNAVIYGGGGVIGGAVARAFARE
jgi:hypothetical protein